MPLREQPSAGREPLSFVLGSPAKVAALRVLVGTGAPITQRDLARRAGIQHRSAQAALEVLVQMGIVTRQLGGRDHLVALNDAHQLAHAVSTLFGTESGYFTGLLAALAELLPKRVVLSAVLFGSTARGTDGPESDYDLLVIGRDAESLATVLDGVGEQGKSITRRFGRRVAPIGYPLNEAQRRRKARRAPFEDIGRDAVQVCGQPLAKVLDGED